MTIKRSLELNSNPNKVLKLVNDQNNSLQTIQKQFHEKDMGITCFINGSIPPFKGIIKHRFNDFHVYEVDSMGNTVYLTNNTIPNLIKTNVKILNTNAEKCQEIANIIGNNEFASELLNMLENNEIPSITTPVIFINAHPP